MGRCSEIVTSAFTKENREITQHPHPITVQLVRNVRTSELCFRTCTLIQTEMQISAVAAVLLSFAVRHKRGHGQCSGFVGEDVFFSTRTVT